MSDNRGGEIEYFDSLILGDTLVIGPENISPITETTRKVVPHGTSALQVHENGKIFAVAGKSGMVRLYSCEDLFLRGIGVTDQPILKIIFVPGLLICLKEDGSIIVFRAEVR